MNADLERIAQALGGAHRNSDKSWTARCPAHDDQTPSLTISWKNGRLLWHCHAGCSQEAVADALRAHGLIDEPRRGGNGAERPSAKQRSGSGSAPAGEEWRPIMPAPADAAPTQKNFRHYRYGEPTVAWTYRNAAGQVLFCTARFDPPGGDKQVLPLTYGILKGRKGWHWKAPSEPRPLYRLNQLAERPSAPVLVVEGEKVVNAADKLFPECVAVTWQGGCKAVAKADWTPLQDRDVMIWPDADQAGHDAALEIACRLPGCRVVNLPPGLPEGWDLADPLPDGLDPRAILENAAKGQPAADDWPEPEPLIADHQKPRPYPIDALPPVMRAAVLSYQAFGQQPVELVACSALSAASLACQALADVDRDGNLHGPCSLFFGIVAKSGERKSAADKRMRRALDAWEREKLDEQAPQIKAARRRHAAWQAKQEGMLSRIRRIAYSTKAEHEIEVQQLESKLLALEQEEPEVPPEVALFHEETTPEQLAIVLANSWPSSSLWSDEAGLVIGSHSMTEKVAMRFLALLSRLWDGGDFKRERASQESAYLRGRRFSVSLMMQPHVLATFVNVGDGVARGIGALARYLIAWPDSTMGARPYAEGDLESPALAAYDARIHTLLNLPLPLDQAHALHPPRLRLAPAAFRVWRNFHDDVERELGRHGEFSDVADFGAKIAEQAARLACVMHIFVHGPTGQISEPHMLAGAQITLWHLHETRRALSRLARYTETADAEVLLKWLQDRDTPPSLGDVLQRGPYRLRDKKPRDAAIALLAEHNLARLEPTGNNAFQITLNPALRPSA